MANEQLVPLVKIDVIQSLFNKVDNLIIGGGMAYTFAKAIGGTKHFIIEQESYQGIAPLECARINLERIKTWGLV